MTLIFAFAILPLLPLGFLIKAFLDRHLNGWMPVKTWAGIFVVVLLVDPVTQAVIIEPLDNLRGRSLSRRANAAGLVGMDREQVRTLLGEPSRVKHYGNDEPTWEYKQVPGYWSGSHFQVFFKNDLVYGFEPNDD